MSSSIDRTHHPEADATTVWKLTTAEAWAALFTILVTLVARVHAFLPGYSIDDYVHVLYPEHLTMSMAAVRGRPLVFPMMEFLRWLGMSPADAMPLSTLTLVLSLVFVGIVVCRLLEIQDRILECATVMSFLSLFPYQGEIFTFRTASLMLAVPLVLTFGAIAIQPTRFHHWMAGITAIVAALCIYQVVLNYVGIVILFSILFHVVRGSGVNFWPRLRRTILLIVIAMGAYMGVISLTLKWTGIHSQQMAMLSSADEVAKRLREIGTLAQTMFFVDEPILPAGTKMLLWAILLISAAVVVINTQRRGRPMQHWLRALLLGVAILAGMVVCIGMVAVVRDWWPVPRVRSHSGLFWGCLMTLGLTFASPGLRRILAALGGVAILSFIGINNQIYSEQLRLNERDKARANRIYAEVEKLPDFKSLRGVYIHGGNWYYRSGFRTVQGDLNISAFSVRWAKPFLLEEISGVNNYPPSNELADRAAAYCRDTPQWPAPRSLTRIDDYAVVCLEAP